MPHGGLHWGPTFLTFKGVASDIPPVENAQRFSNLKADWANGDNDVAWNFGVDVIYRVPLSSINSEKMGCWI